MWMAAIVSAALDTLVLAPPLWLWAPRVPCPWACGSRCCSIVAPCCLAPRWWLQQPCGRCHFPPRAPGALFLPWVPSPCRCAPGAPSAPASAVPSASLLARKFWCQLLLPSLARKFWCQFLAAATSRSGDPRYQGGMRSDFVLYPLLVLRLALHACGMGRRGRSGTVVGYFMVVDLRGQVEVAGL